MYEVNADPVKNRLYVKLSGFMQAKELTEMANAVIAASKKLRPGFDFINDSTDFRPATEHDAAEIGRAQAALVKAGLKRVVRIVKSKVAWMQLDRLANTAGYSAETAATFEEAVEMLEKP